MEIVRQSVAQKTLFISNSIHFNNSSTEKIKTQTIYMERKDKEISLMLINSLIIPIHQTMLST